MFPRITFPLEFWSPCFLQGELNLHWVNEFFIVPVIGGCAVTLRVSWGALTVRFSTISETILRTLV